MSDTARAPLLLLLPAGFVVWSSAFVALYAVQALGCAGGWDTARIGPVSVLRLLLLATWIAHLAALAGLIQLCRNAAAADPVSAGAAAKFLARSSLAATIVALIATVWIGIPIFGTSMCR